jgi:hypothetical protein
MQKNYLLLRNNIQLGPFTIEELLEQEILPTDLIWIEGKSLAWSYASELNLLKLARKSSEGTRKSHGGGPHGHTANSKRKRARVRRSEGPYDPPSDHPASTPLLAAPMTSAFTEADVEKKAEELRQRALAAERTHYKQPTPVQSNYTPAYDESEESDIEFIYHKRGLNIPFPQVLVGGMIIAMLVAGWYGQPLFRQKTDTVDATATPLNSTEENTARASSKKHQPPVQALVDSTALKDSIALQDSLQLAAARDSAANAQKQSIARLQREAAHKRAGADTAAAVQPDVIAKADSGAETGTDPDSMAIVVTPKKESSTESLDSAAADGKERKRGFLRGIFKKKKNKDAAPVEEGDSTQHGNGTGDQ